MQKNVGGWIPPPLVAGGLKECSASPSFFVKVSEFGLVTPALKATELCVKRKMLASPSCFIQTLNQSVG